MDYPITAFILRKLAFCYFFLVCTDGFYGSECKTVCGPCKDNDVCDKVSGRCPNGCQIHWTGDRCDGQCLMFRQHITCPIYTIFRIYLTFCWYCYKWWNYNASPQKSWKPLPLLLIFVFIKRLYFNNQTYIWLCFSFSLLSYGCITKIKHIYIYLWFCFPFLLLLLQSCIPNIKHISDFTSHFFQHVAIIFMDLSVTFSVDTV